jgi:small-conductance mechanosensitive channel
LQTVAPAFEQAEASAVKNFFVQDSPPLWSLGVEQWREASRAPLIPPASAALLKAYIRRDRTILYLHAAIILFVALPLFWVRRWEQKWTDEEPNLRGAAKVFDLPVSTAVTLSFLVLGSTYSVAPFLLRAMLWGVLIISITLILRRLIDRALFPMLNALIVLYFVDQLRLLTELLPLLGRLVFGAEMLGGTLFLSWLVWTKHSPAVRGNTTKLFTQAIRFAIQIGLIIFLVTFLAIVFGYVNFANLLWGGVIRSAYVGAAVYTALRIVEGLIIISLGTRPLGLMRAVRLNRQMLQRRICAGAFTVGVGFGLQTVINNFVCGLILLFERPIKVGDIIQIDADIGEVRRIGIRACIIRTTDGSEVIVPNGAIIANKVTNWTLTDRYRAIEVLVTVARGAAPQHVIEVLKRVAANQPGIAKQPAPQAYVVSFASVAISFNLRVWTDQYEDWIQVRSNLAVAMDEALTRENIAVA